MKKKYRRSISKKKFGKIFDRDYFKRGYETGKSLYTNFRWLPEFSFPIAHDFVVGLEIKKEDSIIIYGDAMGYTVKALRLMGYNAYGIDISNYAIQHTDPDIKPFVHLSASRRFNCGLCKDVLEHSPQECDVMANIEEMSKMAKKWLVIVPLGDGQNYNIPLYVEDPSHYIKQPQEWWIERFKEFFKIISIHDRFGQIKRKWVEINTKGNLFAILQSK